MKRFDIVTVGQMLLDTILRPVDRLPRPNECLLLDSLQHATGGCTLNTAVALAKLGVRTALASAVGRDLAGDYLLAECRRLGIATEAVRVRADTSTTSSFVLVSSSGERCFYYKPGAAEAFSLADVDFAAIDAAPALHLSGITKLVSLDAAALLREAKRRGKTVSLDMDWDPQGRWLERVCPLLPHTDVFMPSDDEARRITGRDTPEAMAGFLKDAGARAVAIKLGARGSFYSGADGEEGYAKGFRVPVADTTGAGDAFCAGFLSRQLRGAPLAECCRWGNACGALTVTRAGAAAGIEDFEQVRRLAEGDG